MSWIDPELVLTGSLVRLEPVRADHIPALTEAVADGRLWELHHTSVPEPQDVAAMVESRISLREQEKQYSFVTVRRSDEQVIGMTSFYNLDPVTPKLMVGYTWNRASAHGTGTNPDSKLLLLGHAFEVLGCQSVVLQTNFVNFASRDAIARLGARQDGILRNDTRDREGNLRDTVQFSILPHEWPTIRSGLQRRAGKNRQRG